ncbi:MAG: hypothetical protein JXB10_09960 [Pirellulales bacterium]|nr:hypothetical protein [Pirellulales bacterium]
MDFLRRYYESRFRRIFWACLALVLATGIAGCGDGRPKRVPVSGRVLIDGKPLETGFVQVVPKGNRAASGPLGSGGRFTLTTFSDNDGCVLGKHSVAVLANKSLSPTAIRWIAPKKYMDSATSGIEIEVKGPCDDMEIRLTWKGNDPPHPYTEYFEAE